MRFWSAQHDSIRAKPQCARTGRCAESARRKHAGAPGQAASRAGAPGQAASRAGTPGQAVSRASAPRQTASRASAPIKSTQHLPEHPARHRIQEAVVGQGPCRAKDRARSKGAAAHKTVHRGPDNPLSPRAQRRLRFRQNRHPTVPRRPSRAAPAAPATRPRPPIRNYARRRLRTPATAHAEPAAASATSAAVPSPVAGR